MAYPRRQEPVLQGGRPRRALGGRMRLSPLAVIMLGTSMAAAAPGAKPAAASPSKGATVLCTIRSPDEAGAPRVAFDGPCRFRGEGKEGSFSLSALDGKSPLYPGI